MHLTTPADRDSAIEVLKEMVRTVTLANHYTAVMITSANQDLAGPPLAKLLKVAASSEAIAVGAVSGFFDDLYTEPPSFFSANTDRGEVKEYLLSTSQFNVAQYLKNNMKRRSCLSLVAKSIFSVPTSSTSSVRIFSVAERTVLLKIEDHSLIPIQLMTFYFYVDCNCN